MDLSLLPTTANLSEHSNFSNRHLNVTISDAPCRGQILKNPGNFRIHLRRLGAPSVARVDDTRSQFLLAKIELAFFISVSFL